MLASRKQTRDNDFDFEHKFSLIEALITQVTSVKYDRMFNFLPKWNNNEYNYWNEFH